MDDRTMLELAALAAGMHVKGYRFDETDNLVALIVGKKFTRHKYDWNPMTDDGDALRLAVRLRLEVNCTIPDKPTISVYGNSQGKMVACHEDKVPDPYAATRRAVVRAAAEIGKQMKENEQ